MPDRKPGRPRGDARQRILTAAEAIARTEGPTSMSLDAVAARAGVSKGGLLYHFPSKAKLMQALISEYLSRFDSVLETEERTGRPNAVILAYIEHFRTEMKKGTPPATGLLAAFAENPDLLAPVRLHERGFLNRVRANAVDPKAATIAFLTIQALRSMALLNTCVLDPDEMTQIVDDLTESLR